ncbi:PAS domain S-box protein [Rhizobium sp. BK538]|uniref:PAS domain S-box protein n=1 Tax=Rhizobium sp. BK538 TaxID=2586984 RepID=UPI00160AC130|nr:PAS domain S-box protein [Rhizobium sp. BK538]MBB4169012.1 PAS domain S-box-containing protein [Rhizobium sp. BK538]
MGTDQTDILDALPAMILSTDMNGEIKFVNRRWLQSVGFSGTHETRFEWRDLIDPRDLSKFLEAWQSIRASQKSGEVEVRMRDLNGDYRSHLFQVSPAEGRKGRGWHVVATDVENLRHAEEGLRRKTFEFHGMVNAISLPLAVTTPEGEVEALNQPALEYFGKTLEELKGWKASDVVHPDDLEPTIAAQMEAHRLGASYNVESRHRRVDGVYRWHNVLGMPLRDQDGQILRWLHLLIDIEEKKCAEHALAVRERESRHILDSIPARVGVYDIDGNLVAANKQASELSWIPDKLDWRELCHPDDVERCESRWGASLKSGTPFACEYRARVSDGSYRWHLGRRVPMRDENGTIVRWYGVSYDIEDLKRAECALQESERNLQVTIDTIPALAWSARTDGTAEFLSKHYLDYLGLSSEQAVGWGWASAVYPDDFERLQAIWQEALASGRAAEAEARLRRFDGEFRWFLFRVSPLKNASGEVVKWYGVNTDIEDRKRSDETYRTIVETTPECVKLIARDGTVLQVNAAGAGMAGVQHSGQVIGLNFFDFVAPEHRDRYREFHEQICSGTRGGLEFDLVNALGARRHMETHAAPLRHVDGSVVQLGVTRDITERREAQDRLRRSEAFLMEGQHLARMGNFSWNAASGEIVWSEQLYRIFEIEPGSVVSLDQIAARIHPEDLPHLVAMVQQMEHGRGDFEYQLRILVDDEDVKYVHLIAHRDQEDKDVYIGAVLDETQRRHSEDALENLRSELAQVSRFVSLGTLTASIAHEVNQPLAGIVTNAGTCLRMLAADPPKIERAQETARRTIRDGKRAAEVIARLRSLFSNREAATEPTDLNDAVREVIALSSNDLQRNQVILRTELSDELPLVEGDRVQLQQVVMNLLRNAVDAMANVTGRKRTAILRTSLREDGTVRFSVTDSGIGLGNGGAEKLFQAFYTTKSDGMGIGLSVSRSIIESHKGRLWAEPNNGVGATFAFVVPASIGEAVSLEPPMSAKNGGYEIRKAAGNP